MAISTERPEDGDDEIELGRIVAILWAGKWLVAFAAAVGLAIGIFRYETTPPVYRADALIQLEEGTGRLALPEGLARLAEADPRTTTEIEIIRSRMVLGQVVAELNLDWHVAPALAPAFGVALAQRPLPLPEIDRLTPFARAGEGIVLEFLEVPPAWVGEGMPLTVAAEPGAYDIVTPDGAVHRGRAGTLLRVPFGEASMSIEIGAIAAPPGRRYTVAQRSRRSAIASVRGRFGVTELGRNSGVLRLTYSDTDRTRAREVLDGIARVYVRQNIARSAAEAESSLRFIEAQLPEARQRISEAEAALDAYLRSQELIDLDVEAQSLLGRITGAEALLERVRRQQARIAEQYAETHPSYRRLEEQAEQIEAQLADLRAQVGGLPETQRAVVNLNRDLEMAQEVYTQLLVRAQEVEVLRASTVGNVRVVDDAVLSGRIAPRRGRVLGLSLLAGLLSGIGFVLFRAWARRGVQSVEQIEALGLPVLATIMRGPKGRVSLQGRKTADILALTDPTSLTVEAFRSLRTSLHFGMLDARTRSLAITSSAPEAGKSFTAVNYATVAAQGGQRICLVDGDLRRGQLRKFFGLPKNAPGLAEHLAGDASLDDVLVRTQVEGLSVVPTGRYPPNPSELLMREEMARLIERLSAEHDLLVIDCPPTLATTDPVVIGRQTGAVVVVVRFDETPVEEVRAVMRSFELSDIKIAGAIFNDIDPARARMRGYAYNYRYEYKTR